MKKHIIPFLLYVLIGIAGCYDDDSKWATEESLIADISIANVPKDTTAVAFNTVLEIFPEVGGYPEEELSYAWYIYGGSFRDQTENGYRSVKISSEKELSYEVNLRQGKYTLVFEATHIATGYTMMTEMSLTVSTSFSQGFYILKENSEGNAELDIYNHDNDLLLSNVLGGSLQGAPRSLSVVYGKKYINPDNAASESGTMAFITTEENEIACLRTEDIVNIFDRSSLLFGEMATDDIPYCMASGSYCNFYFSSKGVRADVSSDYSTGRLGNPVGEGGSKFVQAYDGMGLLFWDEQNHRLMSVDIQGYSVEEILYFGDEIVWNDVNALATGWNSLAGTNTLWYLFEGKSGERYLVFVDSYLGITEVRKLSNNLHLAQGNLFAGNALSSYSLYCVNNNKLYRYSLGNDGSETALTPTDLPAGDIVFISDIFFAASFFAYAPDFNYFTIGVQNGNEYTLCMYEMVGGQPYGKPVHSITGEGKLKEVRYVSQEELSMPNLYALLMGSCPNFPY